MSLSQLIKANKFNYVNSNITAKNFPEQSIATKLEIVSIQKSATTSEVEKMMQTKGLRPANIYELLTYAQKEWNSKDWIAALGSAWVRSDGYRFVPCLVRDGSERCLGLYWGAPSIGWGDDWRFLAVVAPSKVSSSLNTSGRLEALEKQIEQLRKVINF